MQIIDFSVPSTPPQTITNKKSEESVKEVFISTHSEKRTSTFSTSDNEAMLMKVFPGKFLFTLKEAAQILNISYEFLRVYTSEGIIELISFGDKRMIHIQVLSTLLTFGIK